MVLNSDVGFHQEGRKLLKHFVSEREGVKGIARKIEAIDWLSVFVEVPLKPEVLRGHLQPLALESLDDVGAVMPFARDLFGLLRKPVVCEAALKPAVCEAALTTA